METTWSIFIDLKKAFDTDYKILVKELNYCGIHSISNKWFQPYLANRQLYVSFNNSESSQLKVLCGFPKGFTLGLLLFYIHKNELHKAFVN